jgi:hypothetical protein
MEIFLGVGIPFTVAATIIYMVIVFDCDSSFAENLRFRSDSLRIYHILFWMTIGLPTFLVLLTTLKIRK